MALVLGNSCSPAKDGKRYNWTFYVRGATEELDSVTIKLHPTFKDPVRVRQEPPFEFQSRGWGTFDIVVLLKWKNGSIHRTSWELQFDQPDASRPLDLPRAAPAGTMAPSVEVPPVAPWEEEHRDVFEARGSIVGVDSADEAMVEAAEEEATDGPGPPPELLRDTSAGTTDDDPTRASICERLRSTAYLPHSHPQFMFGRGYGGPLNAPKVLWRSDQPPRKDHSCPKWLTATEFEDQPEVMAAKVKELARLMLMSRKTVAYTGAGISAAVIGQAALSGQHTVGWKADTRAAPPTFTHHALGFLGRQGLLHGWVQQNHDGLPQKAGFPQERINEIHGSWYDPGNPVVKYSGTLHERSYPWMREDADTADLCLVLGTSLGGLNADQVATKTADRSLQPSAPPEGVLAPGAWVMLRRGGRSFKGCVTKVEEKDFQARFRPAADDDSEEEDDRLGEVVTISKSEKFDLLPSVGGGLGTVIMNLQQTAQDGKMTLRLFGKSDEILRLLLPELGFGLSIVKPPVWPKVSRALVPYDAEGRRLPPRAKRMWLDLSRGQEVRLTPGHNIQGAKQPQYMHIGAAKPITVKGETRKPGVGLGRVVNRCDKTCSFVLQIEGVQMRLGIWWLESAMRGGVPVLPLVNQACAPAGQPQRGIVTWIKCVISMFLDFFLFFVSSLGVIFASLLQQTCEIPLWWFLAFVGVVASVSAVLYARMSWMEYGSDRIWMLYGFLTFAVFLLQGGTMVWGGYLCWLAMQSTECAADVLNFTLVCTGLLAIIEFIGFISVYFVFIPSFMIQLRAAAKFT
ncbi:NAD-dependent protein deacetylase Sirt7 (Regulatory protein SIR2 homolog 7) (SIR2-like protein 7) [Durusdinium trenchii]|uniref:NAD-dependent protein deacetylase Sirt7 (Regulatory protein SIR2 homolog 7) (SIR2-like protein 7) n=1 Tax=Durusdinium trenchii TaxID=1381693 RepID=A0ABP0K1R9_9DINO